MTFLYPDPTVPRKSKILDTRFSRKPKRVQLKNNKKLSRDEPEWIHSEWFTTGPFGDDILKKISILKMAVAAEAAAAVAVTLNDMSCY